MKRNDPTLIIRTTFARILLLAALLLAAMPATIALADGALSEGFTTTETNLPTGSLLSLKSGSKTDVEITTTKTQLHLLGVVGKDTLIQLGDGINQVQTVVTGRAPVLVSDINGSVKKGDNLGASPISGVAMKATTAGLVVGTAQADLSQAKAAPHVVKDKTGKSQTVHVGLVTAQIDVTYYAPPQDEIKPLLPSFLVSVGRTIAGKDVSGIRVVISMLVLLLGFATVAVMLQAGIRSGITAIGRNPLAHTEIRRSLLDVTVTSMVVLLLSIMLIYVTLTV